MSHTGAGASVDLNFHTEVAFHPRRPHLLILVCLQQSVPPTGTLLVDMASAVGSLSSTVQNVLRRPLFTFAPPESFRSDFASNSKVNCSVPIVAGSGRDLDVRLNFNPGRMTSNNPEGRLAITKLHGALAAGAFPVFLEPGSLLAFDNRRIAHGRRRFEARFDQFDRWFKRIYVCRDLWRVPGDPCPPSRLVAP
jgi:L-asparagine oxygenase